MRIATVFPLVFCVLASPTALIAQSNTAVASAEQITLNVTVNTRSGEPVPGLAQTDFAVFDDKAPQPLTAFRELTAKQAETKFILVLDDVNMPYPRLTYARQELGKMLSSGDGQLLQPATLAVLTNTGMRIEPRFTTNGRDLQASLDSANIGLRDITRSAGFYGAAERLETSLNGLRMLIVHEAREPGRKRIVWISPGWPLLSGPSVQMSSGQMRALFGEIVELSTEMRRANVTLDAVNPLGAGENVAATNYYENFLKGVRDVKQVEPGDLGLQVLAIQSGGLVLNGSNDIAGLLQRCFDQTRAMYELSFTASPGEHANEYHQIQVQVNKPGLIAHTRTGYYAQPSYASAVSQSH